MVYYFFKFPHNFIHSYNTCNHEEYLINIIIVCHYWKLHLSSCYFRFPESQAPKFSKFLRVVAFAYPYLFDNIPLFYRVGPHLCTSQMSSHKTHLKRRVSPVCVTDNIQYIAYCLKHKSLNGMHIVNLHKLWYDIWCESGPVTMKK